MSLLGRLIGSVLRRVAERRARGASWSDLGTSLERSGEEIGGRLRRAPDTDRNREVAKHVIGIERWGQRRLRVALGEPLVLDGYRSYRPAEGATMEELGVAFVETRRATLSLVRHLDAVGVDPDLRVRHNDLGELSLRGWLAYLDGHGQREILRLKG